MKLVMVGKECRCGNSTRMETTESVEKCSNCGRIVIFTQAEQQYFQKVANEALNNVDKLA